MPSHTLIHPRALRPSAYENTVLIHVFSGALMYGPPGTGKTLLARACAAQTEATFLKLAGPQLVQMFIGDGAKLVRDCFALAKEKAPSIIFIDELDAVGTKRFDSDKSGDREVQRTMLELLNQLDGFASDDRIKVLAATNRVDVLDPALLRSGRLDRKIEFPLPNEESRAQILRIHSRKMTVDDAVNWPELARSTDEFGGAMLKAVCVEAGMIALRNGHSKISHEHYVDAIAEVQSKKKESYVSNLFCLLSPANSKQHLHLCLRLGDTLFDYALRLGVTWDCNNSWALERGNLVYGLCRSGMSNYKYSVTVSITDNENKLLDIHRPLADTSGPFVSVLLSSTLSEFVVASSRLHFSSTVAKTDLAAPDTSHKPDIFPAVGVHITRPPDLQHELVTRLDRAGEASGKLLDILWIRVSK